MTCCACDSRSGVEEWKRAAQRIDYFMFCCMNLWQQIGNLLPLSEFFSNERKCCFVCLAVGLSDQKRFSHQLSNENAHDKSECWWKLSVFLTFPAQASRVTSVPEANHSFRSRFRQVLDQKPVNALTSHEWDVKNAPERLTGIAFRIEK